MFRPSRNKGISALVAGQYWRICLHLQNKRFKLSRISFHVQFLIPQTDMYSRASSTPTPQQHPLLESWLLLLVTSSSLETNQLTLWIQTSWIWLLWGLAVIRNDTQNLHGINALVDSCQSGRDRQVRYGLHKKKLFAHFHFHRYFYDQIVSWNCQDSSSVGSPPSGAMNKQTTALQCQLKMERDQMKELGQELQPNPLSGLLEKCHSFSSSALQADTKASFRTTGNAISAVNGLYTQQMRVPEQFPEFQEKHGRYLSAEDMKFNVMHPCGPENKL